MFIKLFNTGFGRKIMRNAVLSAYKSQLICGLIIILCGVLYNVVSYLNIHNRYQFKSIIYKYASLTSMNLVNDNNIQNNKILNIDLSYMDTTKATIVIMTYYGNERLSWVYYSIKRYRTYCNGLKDIVIVWNGEIKQESIDFIKSINQTKMNCFSNYDYSYMKESNCKRDNINPTIYLYQMNNSLANRWLIYQYHSFKTLAVSFMDDDNIVDESHIICMTNALSDIQANANMKHIGVSSSNKLYAIGPLGIETRHYWDTFKNQSSIILERLNKSIGIGRYNKYKNDYDNSVLMKNRILYEYGAWAKYVKY